MATTSGQFGGVGIEISVDDGVPHPEQVESKALQLTVGDLKGVSAQAAKLTEWLKLALDEPHLLQTLGATTNLGVLVSGPAGVGKTALVRAVCAGRRLVELDSPEVGAFLWALSRANGGSFVGMSNP